MGVSSDGTIGVEYSLHNGISGYAAIDGQIALIPDGKGGYVSHGSRNGFPSVGIYKWDGKNRTTIKESSEGSPTDLIDIKGAKDEW